MNRKAQKATDINRKHIYRNQNFLKSPGQNQKQNQKQQLSPRAQQQQEIQQKQTDYCFELTEKMIEQGFSEEEVTKYISKLENLVKTNDLEKRENKIKADLKKINLTIKELERNKNSKPNKPKIPQKQEQILEFQIDDFMKPPPFIEDDSYIKDIQTNDNEDNDNGKAQEKQKPTSLPQLKPLPGYADLSRYRNGNGNANANGNHPGNVLIPGKSPRIFNPLVGGKRISKIPAKNQLVKATGAGAQFLASLADDLN